MQSVNNEPDQIEIRRSQNTLIVVGTGTILFTVWSTVKMLSILFMMRKEIVSVFKNKFSEIADTPERIGALTNDQTISGVIIEATSMIMICQMIFSAVRIRKLTARRKRAKF